jgi:hypothetical protein
MIAIPFFIIGSISLVLSILSVYHEEKNSWVGFYVSFMLFSIGFGLMGVGFGWW